MNINRGATFRENQTATRICGAWWSAPAPKAHLISENGFLTVFDTMTGTSFHDKRQQKTKKRQAVRSLTGELHACRCFII